jgi:dolichyl-phosphate-mannose--protein O-mannosyl transferase
VLDKQGNVLTPVNISEAGYTSLFDEQELLDKQDTFMTGTYFDEIYHARTAKEMIDGVYCYENTHPPFGKLLLSLGIRAFGMTPFGWRCVGTLFGVLMLPFIFFFGKRMFRKTWASAAVTLLFAFDFMHFAQTRIATIDVYGTFFIIAMYYFMYWYSQMSFFDTKLWKTLVPLGLCGISMGFGFASKWTAVYAGAGLALILFYIFYLRCSEYVFALKRPGGTTSGISHAHVVKNFWTYTWITIGAAVLFFVIIPGIIYLLSYIPFNDGSNDGLWTRMINNQRTMFDYHSALESDHPYSSWWYQWPAMLHPVYYHSATLLNGMKEGIATFGNPLVWWAGIPAVGYMFYLIVKERSRMAMFLVVAYFAQYVPWMFVTRITFLYHYFPCVPFLVLMLGYAMMRIIRDKPKRIYLIFAYLFCAVAIFAVFYPTISGYPMMDSYLKNGLIWVNGWVLG